MPHEFLTPAEFKQGNKADGEKYSVVHEVYEAFQKVSDQLGNINFTEAVPFAAMGGSVENYIEYCTSYHGFDPRKSDDWEAKLESLNKFFDMISEDDL